MARLQKAKELQQYRIEAEDGEAGTLEDLYFEDRNWRIRYLVVNTGTWLMGRRVLVAPPGIGQVDRQHQRVSLRLTRDQVEHSPPISADQPVSRTYEAEYYRYYGWSPYWDTSLYPGAVVPPDSIVRPPPFDTDDLPSKDLVPKLRSSREVSGYQIAARDGEIGHVEDFIVDNRDWLVRYLEADTRNWLPGKHVLFAAPWTDRIDWSEGRIYVALDRESIATAPAYVPGSGITRRYEEDLHAHYARQGYWVET